MVTNHNGPPPEYQRGDVVVRRLLSALENLVDYSRPLENINEDESHNARRVAIELLDELVEKTTQFSPQNQEQSMGVKAPQPPPPKYQVGDIVIAAVDILNGSIQLVAKAGDRLKLKVVGSKQVLFCHENAAAGSAWYGALLSEITKPPRPTSPPPPRAK